MFRRLACRYLTSRYLDYVCDRLPAVERARVEQHLADCPRCRREVAQYRQAVHLAEDAGREALPAPRRTWQQLRTRLEAEAVPAAPLFPSRGRWLPIAGAAALAAGALLALVAYQAHRGASGPPLPGKTAPQIVKSGQAPPGKALFSPAPVMEGGGDKRATAGNQLAGIPSQKRLGQQHEKPGIVEPGNVSLPLPPAIQREGMVGDIRQLSPGVQPSGSGVRDDLAYVNPDTVASVAGWTHWPSDTLRHMETDLRQRVKGGDSFVTVPLPVIAGADGRAVHAAAEAYQQETARVDVRLVRKVSLAVKGIAFADLCSRLSQETGIPMTANRRVADDKVTIFCRERPLRDLMRQISTLFGFSWLRHGDEGAYTYELTQSLQSQLLEEGLREKDHNEMLLALDRQMEVWRPYLGLSMAQLQARQKALVVKPHDKASFNVFDQLMRLQHGGLVAANMFFRLSQPELDALRSGQTLSWDLSRGGEFGFPATLLENIQASFYGFGGEPSGAQPRSGPITATLRLDNKQPGKYTLMGGLYQSEGGVETTLADTTSPGFAHVDNARDHAALAHDPALQARLSLRVKETCRLVVPPYPDTDLIFMENAGPKVTAADVVEALFAATGRDIIADQFLRLNNPSNVSADNATLFDVLNRIGDTMRMRWTAREGWLQFRSLDYYYARPQEVPTRLLERWAETRRKHGRLLPEDLAEISQLTDAQLDSRTTAQGAVACYGLDEWPVVREAQTRPHWRFLAQLSPAQRQEALSDKGVEFQTLPSGLWPSFVQLSECASIGIWPSEVEMRDARLRVIYAPTNTITEDHIPTDGLLPGGNTVVFLYSYGHPRRYSVIGPFNAIVGESDAMLQERTNRKP